jgi:hypothetical protein
LAGSPEIAALVDADQKFALDDEDPLARAVRSLLYCLVPATAVVSNCYCCHSGWALTFPRRGNSVNSSGGEFLLVMDIAALALAAHAVVVSGELLAGVYAALVTAIVIGAGILFLFAFAHA